MTRKTDVDEAAVQRLQEQIARDRRRLAQRLQLAPEVQEPRTDRPTKIGRLHRVFSLMGEC